MNRILIALVALVSFSTPIFAADNLATTPEKNAWGIFGSADEPKNVTFSTDESDVCVPGATTYVVETSTPVINDKNNENESTGDAKWLVGPVQVSAGATYQVHVCYKGNVESVLAFIYPNDEEGFNPIGDGFSRDAANEWQQLDEEVVIPDTVTTIYFGQIPATAGILMTGDYSLTLKE
jgi:hypothetical protein